VYLETQSQDEKECEVTENEPEVWHLNVEPAKQAEISSRAIK
jgi:hypothetical protein